MAKKTKKQTAQDFLEAHGWKVDTTTKCSKYTVMSKLGWSHHYYLGRSGAVRRGRTVASSVPVALNMTKDMRDEAYQKAAEETVRHDAKQGAEQRPDPTGGLTTSFDMKKLSASQQTSVCQSKNSSQTVHGKTLGTSGSAANARPALPGGLQSNQDSHCQSSKNSALSIQGEASGLGSNAPGCSGPLTPSFGGLATMLKNAGELVAGYTPTAEQRAILDAVTANGLRCLVMPAGAGAGKTSTLRMLEEVIPGRGQGTAFNRPIVVENKAKFKKVKWSTTHGLAFGAVGKLYAHRLNGPRVRSEQVAARLGIADLELTVGLLPDGTPALRKLQAGWLAGQVMVAIRRFCQSADERIAREHFKRVDGIDEASADGRPTYANNDIMRNYLLPFAEKAWADLSSTTGTLPFNHDVYVKVWQLGKGPSKPVIAADYILLDEAQDTAPVFLDVLKQQSHALLIFVGDENQQIYDWRGAINAMGAFPDAPRRQLSQSFRFGQRIADVANSILAGLEVPTDLILKGLDTLPSRVVLDADEQPKVKCVLTRTNAAAIATIMEAKRQDKRTHLIASVDEVVAFVKAARDLKEGRSTAHPELGCFGKWAEVVKHSKTDEGADLRLWVKLIDEFGPDAIIDALDNQSREEDADLVVCTAHKSKGREWDSVRLASDFPPAIKMSDADRRLLYVAATRAKRLLDLSVCTPFHSFKDKQSGEETAGIHITWTGEMPTADQSEATEAQAPKAEPVQAAAPASNGKPNSGEFTWANFNGKWCVGGPAGHEDKQVKVVRRNGTTSLERLGKVIKQFPNRCIYELA